VERQVSKEEGREFAKLHSALFIETSAKTKAGLLQCFDELVTNVLNQQHHSSNKPNEAVDISSQSNRNASAGVGTLGICGC
jgi:hypothetical protein